MKKSLMIVAFALTLAACGKSEKMSYEYEVNGCKTGKQEFDSKQDMCAGLLDEERNHGCAESTRKDAYKSMGC